MLITTHTSALHGATIPREPEPRTACLSYGSDNAGGVHLHLGGERIHLSGDAAHDLAAGLMAEATRPPSPAVTTRRRYTAESTTGPDEVQILREPEGITVSLHPGEGECRCGLTLLVGSDVDLAPLGDGRYRVTRCATGEVLGEVTDVPEPAPWEATR